MKKIVFMAVAAIAMLSSCSNEEFTQSLNQGIDDESMVFTGTIENDAVTSRSTLTSSKSTEWSAGDLVTIGGTIFSAKSAGALASFSKLNTNDAKASKEDGKYKAYYPSSMYNGGAIALPASYTYEEGKFNMPMYAESTTTALAFQNICGVLALKVTSAQAATMKAITVTSDKAISGASSISGDGATTKYTAVANSTEDADKSVTLNCGDGVALDATGRVFYLPVPKGDHKLTITVDDGTSLKSMKTSSAVTIDRNKIYNLTFKAKSSVDYVEIGGLKWATMNLGATTVAESQETSFGSYYAWGEPQTWVSSIAWNTDSWGGEITLIDEKADLAYGWPDSYYHDGESVGHFTDQPFWDACGHYAPTTGTTRCLDNDHDAANVALGGSWRMPSAEEFKALTVACGAANATITNGLISISEFTGSTITSGGMYWIKPTKGSSRTIDGVAYKVRGTLFVATADPSKRLFFPAAGVIRGNSFEGTAGFIGCYWSSSLHYSDSSYELYLDGGNVDPENIILRYLGKTIRPVSE